MTLFGEMYVLGQMLTPDWRTGVLGKVVTYRNEWLGKESVEKREDEITALPTGNQAVPTIEPDWDYNTAKGRWDQSHFVRCILEGLRQARSKPLNYGKLADILHLGQFPRDSWEHICLKLTYFMEMEPRRGQLPINRASSTSDYFKPNSNSNNYKSDTILGSGAMHACLVISDSLRPHEL